MMTEVVGKPLGLKLEEDSTYGVTRTSFSSKSVNNPFCLYNTNTVKDYYRYGK